MYQATGVYSITGAPAESKILWGTQDRAWSTISNSRPPWWNRPCRKNKRALRRQCGVRRREPVYQATGVYSITGAPAESKILWGTRGRAWSTISSSRPHWWNRRCRRAETRQKVCAARRLFLNAFRGHAPEKHRNPPFFLKKTAKPARRAEPLCREKPSGAVFRQRFIPLRS